jgi:hypothetical protein
MHFANIMPKNRPRFARSSDVQVIEKLLIFIENYQSMKKEKFYLLFLLHK